MINSSDEIFTLLVCTVGGSAEPIVATLKRWNPVRIQFVPTSETREQIETRILPMARSEGVSIDPGRYDVVQLPDGQDFATCVNTLRLLQPVVDEWLSRGEKYQVVADFTGGTKCMSAALALQAHRWRCVFSYVGGSERSKDGVGVVVSGKEQVQPSTTEVIDAEPSQVPIVESVTERTQLVLVRTVQSFFRNAVLASYEYR